jgi:phosphoglycolate phosphatase
LRVPVLGGGRLDPEIFMEIAATQGLTADDATFSAFAAALVEQHAAGAELFRSSAQLLAGGAEAMARLAVRPGVVQSVLTGNIEPVARHKLAAFQLDRHLDLEIGAYGQDAPTRPELVGIARTRAAARHGSRFEGPRTVLVGDTIHDVGAARANGARVVAVASGRTGPDELRAAGADAVFPDLTGTAAVVDAIIGH